jgi:hypothetical protein
VSLVRRIVDDPWDEQLSEFLDEARGLKPIAAKFISSRGERLGLRIYNTRGLRWVWVLRMQGVPVGAGSVDHLPVEGIYVIGFSVINPMQRGLGHYRAVLLELNDFFDERLCSDEDDSISDAAAAAWTKIGAVPRPFVKPSGDQVTRFCFPRRERR